MWELSDNMSGEGLERSRRYAEYEALLEEFESTGKIEPLRRMFQILDLDGDRRVSKQELLAFYRTREQEREAMQVTRSFFKLGDTNQDGVLDEEEFLALFTSTSNPAEDEQALLSPTEKECKRLLDLYEETRDDELLRQCFRLLDLNGDGVVSKGELRKSYLCRGKSGEEAVRVLMQLGDTNQDGVLSAEEFERLIKQSLQ